MAKNQKKVAPEKKGDEEYRYGLVAYGFALLLFLLLFIAFIVAIQVGVPEMINDRPQGNTYKTLREIR